MHSPPNCRSARRQCASRSRVRLTEAGAASAAEVKRAIDAIWRIEAPRLIAGLARFCNGDITCAEDLAQDAVLVALERWGKDGIPRNPGAWLMTTAKHRQIDLARRSAVFQVKREQLARQQPTSTELELPEAIEDDLLSLIFTTCHPLLTRESQVALTLRLFGGLTTAEVARAMLTSEATVGARIARAKRTLADAGSPFDVPAEDQFDERLTAVLAVVYLIFNEGYSPAGGEQWIRRDLSEEALRLGRVLQGLMPERPEVHGLAGLLEIQSSRMRARIGSDGAAIPLPRQQRQLWDRELIDRGLSAIDRAHHSPGRPGIYTLQAEIAACHAVAADYASTDWKRIASLYRVLAELTQSPVVEVNRALAVGMDEGADAGLAVLDAVSESPALAGYHLVAAVRGELLELAGRRREAAAEFEHAAAAAGNEPERRELLRRAGALSGGSAARWP